MDRKAILKEAVRKHLRPMAPIPTGVQRHGDLVPPIEAVLCDIYGTLFISGCGDLSIARQQTAPMDQMGSLLARYGVSLPPEQLRRDLHALIERHHQDARGKGIDHPEVRIEQIWSKLLPIQDTAQLACFAVEYEMVVNPAWPMPNAAALLCACRQQRIQLGIISNAQFFTPCLFDWLLGRSMKALGFHEKLIFFSFKWGEAKPSPRLFQAAVRQLQAMGIAPRRTVYIGNDMRKDILPAAEAGFQTVLFAGDARSLRPLNDLPDAGAGLPDLVVTDLQQLIEYFKR